MLNEKWVLTKAVHFLFILSRLLHRELCAIIISALQYFLCVVSNMMQFECTGITPVNLFTQVQQADSKGLLVLFDRRVK